MEEFWSSIVTPKGFLSSGQNEFYNGKEAAYRYWFPQKVQNVLSPARSSAINCVLTQWVPSAPAHEIKIIFLVI